MEASSSGNSTLTSSNSNPSSSYSYDDSSFDVQSLIDVHTLVEYYPRYSQEIRDFMNNVLKFIRSMTKFMAKLGFSEEDDDNPEPIVKGKAPVEIDYSFKHKASYFSLVNRSFIKSISESLQGVYNAFCQLDRGMLRPCVQNILNCIDDVRSFMAENFGYKDDQLGFVGPQPLILDSSNIYDDDGLSFSGRQIHHIILSVHRMSENLPRYALEMSELLYKVRKLKSKANKIRAKSGLQLRGCKI